MTTTLEDTRSAARRRMGFGSMTPQERSRIARLGGIAAHALGRAHKWTSEEARIAGRIGGAKSRRRPRWMIEEAKQYV